jgi:hypothetical protein
MRVAPRVCTVQMMKQVDTVEVSVASKHEAFAVELAAQEQANATRLGMEKQWMHEAVAGKTEAHHLQAEQLKRKVRVRYHRRQPRSPPTAVRCYWQRRACCAHPPSDCACVVRRWSSQVLAFPPRGMRRGTTTPLSGWGERGIVDERGG